VAGIESTVQMMLDDPRMARLSPAGSVQPAETAA